MVEPSARGSRNTILLTALITVVVSVALYNFRPNLLSPLLRSHEVWSPPQDAVPALFQPITIGDITLTHRVVLAPLTRYRSDDAHVPTNLGVEYYAQRASVPGTLLITEATYVSGQASGQPNAPGIWTDEQVAGWKKIVDAVHAKGSYIYLQLWALGRAARPAMLHAEFPEYPYVSSSNIPLSTSPEDIPRPLTRDEIKDYVRWHAEAAANAVHRSGFDGVEVHGANGYQFLQDVSNNRTDDYGGSAENRARFALEVLDAVVEAAGQMKTAIRLNPWGRYQDMRMEDPVPTFTYLVEQIKHRHPDLAYLHVVSPDAPSGEGPADPKQVHFIYKLWHPRPVVSTGGYHRTAGIETAEATGQLIGYGRLFLANPDLPFRLRKDIALNKPDPTTFYTPKSPEGYTTYPFSDEFINETRG